MCVPSPSLSVVVPQNNKAAAYVHLDQARTVQGEREEKERELRVAVEEMKAKRKRDFDEYVVRG